MRKKVISMLCGFLVLMLLFTMLSRAADSMGIPKVNTGAVQSMMIEHKTTAYGKVVQNREQAVSTEANQTVKAIYVNEGQQVEAGDLLFEVDMEKLKEQILSAKQELEKQDLQSGDSQSAIDAAAAKKALSQNQASGDYAEAVEQGDRNVERAKEELDAARNALKEYGGQKGASASGKDTVEAALKETYEEKVKAWEEAKQDLAALQQEIEDKVQEALAALQESAQEETKGAQQTESEEEATGLMQQAPSGLEQQQAEAEVRNQYQAALDAAAEKEEKARNQAEEAEQALAEYHQKQSEQAQVAGSATKEQLRQAVKEKEAAYEDAVSARESAIRQAGKTLEDVQMPEARDSSAKVAQIEREQKELALKKLEELEKAKGKVTSPVKGVVTKVVLTTGDKTPDGTAILLADLSSGNKFIAQISSEQEKYIARKDPVTLKPDNNGKAIDGLTVDSIQTNEEDKNLLDVMVNLPADVLEMGVSATLEVTKKSQPYQSCIPLSSLYYDNSKAYVLVVDEEQTVLGTELVARRVDVNILDKNDKYAAIQEGMITSDQRVIEQSDKNVEAGGRVRLAE